MLPNRQTEPIPGATTFRPVLIASTAMEMGDVAKTVSPNDGTAELLKQQRLPGTRRQDEIPL